MVMKLHGIAKRLSPIGLDLGSTAVRAVQLSSRAGEQRLHAALELPFDEQTRLSLLAAEQDNAKTGGSGGGSSVVSVESTLSADAANGVGLIGDASDGDGTASMVGVNAGDLNTTGDPGPTRGAKKVGPETRPLTASEKVIVERLRLLARHQAFSGKQVVLHCPADHLDLRPAKLPAGPAGLPRAAVIGALRVKMADNLPFDSQQAIHDYFPAGYDEAQKLLTVVAVTADGAWIKRKMELVTAAGLQCIAFDAIPCVLARLARDSFAKLDSPDDDSDALKAVLDIGFSSSTLVVRNQHGPVFCRRFSFGGSTITDKMMNRFMIEHQQAEQLKLVYGIDCAALSGWGGGPGSSSDLDSLGSLGDIPGYDPLAVLGSLENQDGFIDQDSASAAPCPASSLDAGSIDPEQAGERAAMALTNSPTIAETGLDILDRDPAISWTIYNAVRNDLGRLVEGLTRSLNYVINEHRGAALDRLLLCGGASHTRNLPEYLADQFGVPVQRIAHPLIGELAESLPASRSQSGCWALSLGLALAQEGV